MLVADKKGKKQIMIAVMAAFAITIVLFLLYFSSVFCMTEYDIPSNAKTPTMAYLDECSIQYSSMMPKGYWNIRGWLYNKGQDISTVQVYVILQDLKDGTYYKIHNTQSLSRKDVTDWFHDGHNYDQSGFSAQIDSRWLIKGRKYKVGIISIINNDVYFAETNQIIERIK